MERELELLLTALHAPESVQSPELIAEEIAARSYALRDYVWNPDSGAAVRESASGLRVAVRGDLNNDAIALNVQYVDAGQRDRATLGRYLGDAATSLAQQLKAAGWRIGSRATNYADFAIDATISGSVAAQHLDRLATTLDDAIGRLKFE